MGNRRLLDQIRDKIRLKHYSIRTEEAYITWIKDYIIFNHKKHPIEMGATEISKYLTWLAIRKNVVVKVLYDIFESVKKQMLWSLIFQ